MNLSRPADAGHHPSSWAAWRLTRGVLAAIALVAVLVGLPWALLQLTRWPVNGLPSGEQIRNLPAVAAEDSTITALFTIGLWTAWALFALCVVVEILGEISGAAAAPVPGAGPVQRLARSLVASVAMTLGSLGPLGSLTAATGGGLAAIALADASSPAVAEPPPATERPDPQGTCAPEPEPTITWETLTVDYDDTPWELAERHYGDGTRWLQLWEDNRTNLQADGRAWTRQSDPIEPGWQLRIRTEGPDGSAVTEPQQDLPGNDLLGPAALPVGATSVAGTPTEVTARPGDHFWKLAEDHLETTLGRPVTAIEIHPYWLRVIEANQGRLVIPGNANLIYPGQTFLLPALDVPAPPVVQPGSPTPEEPPASTEDTPPQPTPSSSVPETSDAATTETSRPSVDEPARSTPASENGPSPGPPGHDEDSPVATIVGTLAAGAALAVGITRAIRQRRQRRNHRHPRSVPRPSTNPELHRQLIVAADEDAHTQLRQVMQHLGTTLAAAGTSSRPRVVQQGADHVDVLLDVRAQPAGEGWQVQADGAIWSCDPTQLRGTPGSDEPAPTPLLVMLGEPDDGGQLYIDLEAEGVISLTGDLDVARGVARSLVTELAHSPLADSAQVVVVGQLGASLTRLDRVTVVEDWAAAVDDLATWADQSRNVLAANGWASPFVARARGETHDALTPLVVVTDEPPDAADVLSDLRTADPSGTVALVVVGEVGTDATVIDCSPTALFLRDLGLTCAPQLLGGDEVEALADLIDDAEDPSGEQLQLLPDPLTTGQPKQPTAAPTRTRRTRSSSVSWAPSPSRAPRSA